ncbi:PREDICTED: uncharacterized protein LOC104708363 [Camelina sativa]|uniref:Uncharacterized protein LOC104708363 n=1 Tax=Camelina sativa TaxID=90675 RepID=A0ABM0TAA0_CAMSA|nr:PREDICTED: uncharacterized protein LOC104708363 [Camelina sativa]
MRSKAYIPITLDIAKLNNDVWRELFETHCLSFCALSHLDGTSTATPATQQQWKEHDGLVKMWIYDTISESILDIVLKTKSTARELWITIEELFRDNKEARAMEYDTELRTLTIGDSTVADYCKRLKTLSDLLANVESPVTDRQLVMYMLDGLNDKFDSIINVIKHKSPYPSFTVARSMIQLEETRLSKHVQPAPSPPSDTSTPNILYTTTDQQSSRGHHSGHQGRRHRGRGRGSRQNRGRGRYNNHWQYQNPPWGYGQPPYQSPYYAPPPPLYGSTPHMAYPSVPPVQPAHHQPRPHGEAHVTQMLPHSPTPLTYLPHALTNALQTMTIQDPNATPWVIDTGATNHITAQPGILRTTFNSSHLPSVIVGNGSSAKVTHVGSSDQDQAPPLQ